MSFSDIQSCSVRSTSPQVSGENRVRFWERSEIQKAVQYLDAWASVCWHRHYGGTGIPADLSPGNSSDYRRGKPSDMPSMFDAYMTVEEVFKSIKNPKLLMGFLQWVYPRSGTYERDKDATSYRPDVLRKFANALGWSDGRLTQSLLVDEREFLKLLGRRI